MATGSTKPPVNSFLQERRRAMEGCRFKPENFYEISRVLGSHYAPDLNRVMSKHRADAASAYLRRLQRDVERSQGGYYDQLQAMPLQIKRLSVKKEDPRSFKSLLVPKLKLSPLPDATSSSPRSVKSLQAPKMESPQSSRAPPPPSVVAAQSGSSYLPHKFFNPHSHTHIHVLFKQMPGQSHKKGASSVVSTDTSGGSSSNSIITTDSKTSFKSKQHSLKNSKLPTPREDLSPGGGEDEDSSDPTWPSESGAVHYSMPKFPSKNQTPRPPPHMKRMGAEKSPRSEVVAGKSPRPVNNSSRTNYRSPRLDHQPNVAPSAHRKSGGESSPVNPLSGKEPAQEALPVNVASALAAGSSISALYRTKLPQEMASAYDKNLPTMERPVVLAHRSSRLPLPSIPGNANITGEMLAVTSVQHSNAIQVAA